MIIINTYMYMYACMYMCNVYCTIIMQFHVHSIFTFSLVGYFLPKMVKIFVGSKFYISTVHSNDLFIMYIHINLCVCDYVFSFVNVQLYVQRGQLDAKMLGALLTGVNRAFPFLKGTSMYA